MAARFLRSTLILAAVALLVPAQSGAAPTLSCGDLPDLMTIYFQKHVIYRNLDDDLHKRAIDAYIRRVDPQRNLLLEKEADRVASELDKAFKEVRAGNCGRLGKIHELIAERNEKTEKFVRSALKRESYAIDESAELVIDPDERVRPRTEKERDALNLALIHFQISNYIATDIELAEAKERLVHRYELRTKRWLELDRDDIYSSFLDSFANALDPHSSYLSSDDLEDFRIGMQLSLEGIGVGLSERDGYSVVEQIIPGGAADKLDVLQPKDKIIAVAEEGAEFVDVIDKPLRDVVRLIRGRAGSRVHLTVLRQADNTERFPVAIVRDKINLEEQAAKLSFQEVVRGDRKLKLAVLDLPSFYGDRDPSKRQCSRDVTNHLNTIREEKADGLLLDLSRNGGGLLDDAVTISGFFIREGGIVAIKDSWDKKRVLPDPDDGILYDGPMVVLTSRVSASASEILAGAMRDYGRAVVVGDDHTFGKGTVQSVFPLRPGLGALRVTTAMFFRPGGASTQHSGVEADIVVPTLFNTSEFGERNQEHSLPPQSIGAFVSPRANGRGEAKRWTPVSRELIDELAQKSRERIAKNESFQEIAEQLDERADDDGVIQLGEILREREEAEKDGDADDASETGESTAKSTAGESELDLAEQEEEAAEEKTPQRIEALEILADLTSRIS